MPTRRCSRQILSAWIIAVLILLVAVPARASGAGKTAAVAEHAAGTFLVDFVPGQRAAVLDRIRPIGLRSAQRLYGTTTYRIAVPPAASAAALRSLRGSDGVARVETDPILHAATVTPNDPEWANQWGPAKVRAPEAWGRTTGSPDVVVAVLDTGVSAHPDLEGGVLAGTSFVADEPTTEDLNGHGTAVAGVIAARGDNGEAVAGMCWSCAILPVKVLGGDGSGSTSALAEGIRWATDEGADVINLSLGGPDTTSTLESAITYAVDAGVLVIAAAGNDGVASQSYPAASEGVLGVAASDTGDARYSWSNHGSWVDVAAPGCVRTLTNLGGVGGACGTSLATPIVAGIAGLGFSADGTIPSATLVDALANTAVPQDYVASGRVDAEAALASLAGEAVEPSPTPSEEPTEEPTEQPTEEPEPVSDEPAGSPLERLAGGNRFETAVQLSRSRFDPGVSHVFIATGANYPDALAAAPVAAATDAPVLLTGANIVPSSTAEEVARLAPREIVIVGGTGTISPEVEAQLAPLGPVRRIAGKDRFSTAAALADEAFSAPVAVAYVTSGENFPDALSGGAVAARDGAPLLLTGKTTLPAATVEALRALSPGRIVVLGGRSSVEDAVLEALRPLTTSGTVTRHAGGDRFATSATISQEAYPDGATAVYLATGGAFPDALAAGPVAGLGSAPLLLTATDTLPVAVADELARLRPQRIVVAGGTAAVSEEALSAAARAAGLDG